MNPARGHDATTTLRLGASLLRPRDTWLFLACVLGIPTLLLLLVVLAVAADAESPNGVAGTLAALWAELMSDPGQRLMLLVAVLLTPLAAVLFAAQRRAYLRVTALGLDAYLPRGLGLGLFRQTVGSWSVRWEDVGRIRLAAPPERIRNRVQRLGWHRLVIETSAGEVRVHAFAWFDRGGEDHRLSFAELLKPGRLDVAQRLESAPLMRALHARGFEIEREAPDAGPAVPGYDLAQHKGMLSQLVLLLGAGSYAVVDTFFVVGYEPLGPLPLVPFAVTAAVAGLTVSLLGRGAPRIERAGVGGLTIAALVAAAYPATLRLNAQGAQPDVVSYVSLGQGRFEPPAERLPAIDLSGHDLSEYWAEYPPGTEHEFTLLRGRGGFYQLALAPFYDRTREYYGGRRAPAELGRSAPGDTTTHP